MTVCKSGRQKFLKSVLTATAAEADLGEQGRSQEFTKGDKPESLGSEVPSEVHGQNMETIENTNGP